MLISSPSSAAKLSTAGICRRRHGNWLSVLPRSNFEPPRSRSGGSRPSAKQFSSEGSRANSIFSATRGAARMFHLSLDLARDCRCDGIPEVRVGGKSESARPAPREDILLGLGTCRRRRECHALLVARRMDSRFQARWHQCLLVRRFVVRNIIFSNRCWLASLEDRKPLSGARKRPLAGHAWSCAHKRNQSPKTSVTGLVRTQILLLSECLLCLHGARQTP